MMLENLDHYSYCINSLYHKMSYVTIIIFRSSHEGIHDDNIINAAEAFNSHFNIKYWVVHYEVSNQSVANAYSHS